MKILFKKASNRSIKNWEISYKQLQEKVRQGAILLDVRSIQEYNEKHLTGAIQMPYYEISSRAEYVLINKKRDIIVYCQNGGRGKKAYKSLKKLGYENVYNLYGGLEYYNI